MNLDRLRRADEERRYCYAVLDLWDLVRQAGYSWEQVRAFSFRSEFFTKEDRKKHGQYAKDKREYGEWWHNCFILHDGTAIQIPLTDRPYDPCKSQ